VNRTYSTHASNENKEQALHAHKNAEAENASGGKGQGRPTRESTTPHGTHTTGQGKVKPAHMALLCVLASAATAFGCVRYEALVKDHAGESAGLLCQKERRYKCPFPCHS